MELIYECQNRKNSVVFHVNFCFPILSFGGFLILLFLICFFRHFVIPISVDYQYVTSNQQDFMKKNMYDVTRLATLYFPDSTERNARRRLFKVLRAERDLWARLTALHFGVWQRSFTPRQYEMVIDILGKPEETDDDFREWPHE